MAGITGSFHCTLMCGGLVTSTCHGTKDIWLYQIGRLLAYLLLGLTGGYLSYVLDLKTNSPYFSLIPGIFLGLLFIYWGIDAIRGKRTEIPLPKFLSKIYSYLMTKALKFSFSKAFMIGSLSIFLPCGLLYAMILTIISFDNFQNAFLSMLMFWVGTLPAMVIFPQFMQRIFHSLKNKAPKYFAIVMLLLGLSTIGFRVVKFFEISEYQNQNIKELKLNCH